MSELKINIAGVGNDGSMLVRFDDVKVAIPLIKAQAVREAAKKLRVTGQSQWCGGDLLDFGDACGMLFKYANQLEGKADD